MEDAEQVTIVISKHQKAQVEMLVRNGYGLNPESVISFLLRRELDDLLRAGVLVR